MIDDADVSDWRNKNIHDNLCVMYRCRICGFENVDRGIVLTHIRNHYNDDLKELL